MGYPNNTSRDFMYDVFHMPLFKGMEHETLRAYKKMNNSFHGTPVGIPFEQGLAGIAVLQLGMPEEELAGMHSLKASGDISTRFLFTKYIEEKNLFEVKYDLLEYPESYRLHTNGRICHINECGKRIILERGIEKGDFVHYKEIAEWLKENR